MIKKTNVLRKNQEIVKFDMKASKIAQARQTKNPYYRLKKGLKYGH